MLIVFNIAVFSLQSYKFGADGFFGGEGVSEWHKSWGVFSVHLYQGGVFSFEALLQNASINTAYSGVELPVWSTAFTAMFLHADIGHIAGNMLFLWIFGDNVEHAMGHIRFLVFYLLVGFLGAMLYAWTASPESIIPMLGASGAISGVLGAYMLYYPTKDIHVVYSLPGGHIGDTYVPAMMLIGGYLLIDLYGGFMSYGSTSGGTAFFAHVGGMVGGLLLGLVFRDYSVLLLDSDRRRIVLDRVHHCSDEVKDRLRQLREDPTK